RRIAALFLLGATGILRKRVRLRDQTQCDGQTDQFGLHGGNSVSRWTGYFTGQTISGPGGLVNQWFMHETFTLSRCSIGLHRVSLRAAGTYCAPEPLEPVSAGTGVSVQKDPVRLCGQHLPQSHGEIGRASCREGGVSTVVH